MLVCLIVSLVVSLVALRMVDDYFIICTLGVQIIIFSVMNNWMDLTKGPLGIAGISRFRSSESSSMAKSRFCF